MAARAGAADAGAVGVPAEVFEAAEAQLASAIAQAALFKLFNRKARRDRDRCIGVFGPV